MTEAGRKLVVDRRGVTIVGDGFRFSTSATPRDWTDPDLDLLVAEVTGAGDVESVITGLQSMTRLTYGQYCALELIGERWSMLLVRDLLVSPKTIGELRNGLSRMPADTLLARLRELEHGGVVLRTPPSGGVLRTPPSGVDGPRDADDVLVELTEYGHELDEVIILLGRWGARLLGDVRPEDVVSPEALVTALKTGFRPGSTATASFQVEMKSVGVVVHGCVVDGVLSAGLGPVPGGADVVIKPGRHLRKLMTGELDPDEALRSGDIRATGDTALVRTFTELFRIRRAATHPAVS
jgi:DNA-binding HxlR family transcriptional regulator